MTDQNSYPFAINIELPMATAKGLIGKQSVRATFRLSQACIDAIQIVAAHLGIKQKSLFDHLLEDETALSLIADKLGDVDFNHTEGIQKTYVISRRALDLLDRIAETHNASRNAIIEYSVRRLAPIIIREQEKHHQRKNVLDYIEAHYNDGVAMLDRMAAALGDDDAMCQKMAGVLATYEEAMKEMDELIEKGRRIEQFQQNPR
jgi:hypothetical protein